MFENQTFETIRQRMLDNIDNSIDKRQGSVVWDLLSPAAIELAQAYIALDQVLLFGFASENMPSNYLDLRCAEVGLTRKPAAKAIGQVTFVGMEGTVIPNGTRLSTDEVNPIYFVTTEDGVITEGTVTVTAEAEVAGYAGNVATGKITLVVGNLAGITSVTNHAPFQGGIDAESDESLLERYFAHVRKPSTSGNANHYRQWALEISGIGDAKVYPVWNGPGTVKVVLLSTEKTAPTQSIVDEVATHIESVRPIGATVTVVGATEVPINVSATLTLAIGKTLMDAQTEFESLLIEYLKTLAFFDPVVRYSKIASLLLDCPSIVDYSDFTINNGTDNVIVADGSVAVKGMVTFT
ncbi:baseplate J/gp47 family protein [Anoxybacillus gonensis]|uniref:baseplate J/gp47 family protein n=1 Tax=Anoxybacillus gonensis TaxID=198467 RepID=UPI0002C02A36|nr:baseplate J/gp47 family protein [Anoxybacillus gonensis]EMI10361.1 Baseplate J family protein [Anoxybacillus gonensis]